jgi:hypothetical protein
MKRVMGLGRSGAGKSTFARRVAAAPAGGARVLDGNYLNAEGWLLCLDGDRGAGAYLWMIVAPDGAREAQ